MFTSISGPELLMLLVLGLLLFGPRRLPEMGRKVGRAFSEFRRATTDFRLNLEREVAASEIRRTVSDVEEDVREVEGAVSRETRSETTAREADDGRETP